MANQNKFATSLIAIALISGSFFTSQTAAQQRVAEVSDVWYLSYVITIKGNGKIEPETPGGSDIYWKVDRSYAGTIELFKGTPYGIGSGKDAEEAIKAKRYIRFTAAPEGPVMKVAIDDYVIKITEDEVCGDTVKTLDKSTWTANTEGNTLSKFQTSLNIDNQSRSHNVTVPIFIFAAAGDSDRDMVAYKRIQETIKTTAYGKSTSETKPISDKKLSIFDFPIPRIFGLIEDNRIHHNDFLPLKHVDGGYEFESREETVHDKLLPDIDTEDKVKLKVYYRLKK